MPDSPPFRIDNPFPTGLRRAALGAAIPPLERLLRLGTLNALYHRVQADTTDRHFPEKIMDVLGIRIEVDAVDLSRIPRAGPLITVSNHPFGAIEGLGLLALMLSVRPRVRQMTNYMLAAIPEMRPYFLFVDPFGGPAATQRNRSGMKEAMRFLKQGHCLNVFPAGEVSSLGLRRRSVSDKPWSETVARIAGHTKATVLPIYWEGRNSDLFQLLGLLHPRLRTIMLPREMLQQRGTTIRARIGTPIPWDRLGRIDTPAEATEYLRMRTYLLRDRAARPMKRPLPLPASTGKKTPEPIMAPMPVEGLRDDLRRLPAVQRLATCGEFEVYWGRSHQLPHVLREIGRLREVAFRPVGEGTGRSIDLDRFDGYYIHLLAWHVTEHRIVGAYRLGPSEDILPAFGKEGLYSSTLFHYQDHLLNQIRPALELGRSFVHPDFQKTYTPMMLLWKGIALFIARHPQYVRLFGPVSISNEFTSMTKQLLIAFLTINNYAVDLGKLIEPRNPPRVRPFPDFDYRRLTGTAVRDIDQVNELVREIEADQKALPVLLRQYLKLNATLLAFNVDPEFGNALDGLMLVDLTRVDHDILVRYMGRENAEAFLTFHGLPLKLRTTRLAPPSPVQG